MQRYIKNRDFIRPENKKVKTVTIFVGKKRSVGLPLPRIELITGFVSQ